ncbi:MAG TPA: hypothetical protein VEH27_03855 [Methylomirabilota bacterium]|nr:hypothetical protein [Methylomirabilota bacterium]
MILTKPMPFKEAVASREVKRLMPTTLKARELLKLAPEIRERAVFSARVTNAQFLTRVQEEITKLVTGVSPGPGQYTNPTTIRAGLKQLLEQLDYKPEEGKEGTIEDLSSDRRLDLITEMNERDARGYGYWKQGQDAALINEWPAQEFLRVYAREQERLDWPQRWVAAGGKVYGGRMIARKDDPVWVRLSVFGKPYPPFDFGSGMGVQDIDREEAIRLGVIEPDAQIVTQDRGFNEEVSASFASADPEMRAAIEESMEGAFAFQGDVLTWAGGVE